MEKIDIRVDIERNRGIDVRGEMYKRGVDISRDRSGGDPKR